MFVPGAQPSGDAVDLTSFGHPAFRLTWRNPDGVATSHEYQVRADRLSPRS
jgi:hypothetical protein